MYFYKERRNNCLCSLKLDELITYLIILYDCTERTEKVKQEIHNETTLKNNNEIISIINLLYIHDT